MDSYQVKISRLAMKQIRDLEQYISQNLKSPVNALHFLDFLLRKY